MRQTEIVVIGGGPAGLSAAVAAAGRGAEVTVIDRNPVWGGQLIKQTHMFFGSQNQYAAARGIDIPEELLKLLQKTAGKVIFETNTTALGYYDDGVLLLEKDESSFTLRAEKVIVATGGAEKTLPFVNNDLPGIYGAGAVQTLMNVYGVKPGVRVLMIGAGNIGLIVSYQLLQAGVEVAAVIEGSPHIGGYLVHAAKIRRLGVPIYVSHTIKEAYGVKFVEGAVVCRVDENWQTIAGTEKDFVVDAICLAVGLSPLTELLWQAGCLLHFIPALGGYIPQRDENMQTSIAQIYVAGDVAGIEEASIAMVEGRIAGLAAACSLGYTEGAAELLDQYRRELAELRSGESGKKSKLGLRELREL